MMLLETASPPDLRPRSNPRHETVLVVADVSTGWVESALRRAPGRNIQALLFNENGSLSHEVIDLPNGWERLGLPEVQDYSELRQEFLQFLDEWPRRQVADHRSFDDLCRHSDGYSVWWTGPGIERNPDFGIFPKLKILWAFDRAIKALDPSKVFIYSESADVTALLSSRCERGQLPFEILDGSAEHRLSPWKGRSAWLFSSVYRLIVYPAKISIRSLAARLFAATDSGADKPGKHPAIVFTSQFARCVRANGDGLSVWFWQPLCDSITAVVPQARCCHLLRLGREFPGHRAISFFYHTAWPLLRKVDHVVPVKERYAAVGAWLRSVPRQLLALWRYFRLETQPRFRDSFSFAGADISSLYVPRLRETVAGMSEWAQTVGAIVKSLDAVGNVRAMLVFEEMYRPGMVNIAAARVLGIPTIGVQHGTINPSHFMYMIPRGQADRAPIADYFAAYSEYAKEIMTSYGAYPADRIWITGSPRFDELVSNPPDRQGARKRLGLPLDKNVALVTTQTFVWFPAAVKAVFEVARTRDDLMICVKVHPKTVALSSDAYRSMAQQVGASNVVCFDDRFDDLLAACDVLISASSTTILEATLLGRRTISVNFSGEPDRYPYVEDGASLPARSPREMEQALDIVLSPRGGEHLEAERRRFLKRHTGPSATGSAGVVLARKIVELACPEAVGYEPAAVSGLPVADQVSAGISA